MKNRMRLCGILIGLCLFWVAALPMTAMAAGASLRIKYEHSGAGFWIYQLTDGAGNKTAPFKNYTGALSGHTNAEWQKLALDLADYVKKENVNASASGTIKNEELTITGLQTGWYLVCGGTVKEGTNSYTPTPFVIKLTEGAEEFADVKADAEPTTPTDPTDPTSPTDPTGPDTPTKPAGPTDPTGPDNPANPTGPTDPTGPNTPADPTNPADQTRPANTSRPSHSGKPSNTYSPSKSTSDIPTDSYPNVTEPEESLQVEVISDDNLPSSGPDPIIPKLGDAGVIGSVIGMILALGAGCLFFVLYRRSRQDEEA